jgi:hypothetical protein
VLRNWLCQHESVIGVNARICWKSWGYNSDQRLGLPLVHDFYWLWCYQPQPSGCRGCGATTARTSKQKGHQEDEIFEHHRFTTVNPLVQSYRYAQITDKSLTPCQNLHPLNLLPPQSTNAPVLAILPQNDNTTHLCGAHHRAAALAQADTPMTATSQRGQTAQLQPHSSVS